jgi:chemotaxis protein methyltransferase CheR
LINIIKLSDSEFATLVDFVYKGYGINLEKKRVLIEGRMASTLRDRQLSSYSEYLDILFSDKTGQEIIHFLNKITTNHTFFMREMEHFRFMKETALPLFEKNKRRKDLRIWSAGCSSGQEPYTIAMTLEDYFSGKSGMWNISILGTDISMDALEKAKRAEYSEDMLKDVPQAWKDKYFQDLGNGSYRVSDRIRRNVTFRPLNLNEDFFFPRPFDIIFCRNVMIYFDNITRERLIDRFYKVTTDEGFLFVGHSEVVNRRATDFKYVMPAIYRKSGDQ